MELELDKKQIARIDEIENAVFDLLKVFTQDENLEWDIEKIGDIADHVADYLVGKGYKIYYPAIIIENGEPTRIEDYYGS